MAEEDLQGGHGLKVYFTKRIETWLIEKNKKVIGWEEMADADLDKSTTVMGWLGIARGVEAANEGYDVVMAPLT
jgi:hexosaminidase